MLYDNRIMLKFDNSFIVYFFIIIVIITFIYKLEIFINNVS